jgi:hypothetical protein
VERLGLNAVKRSLRPVSFEASDATAAPENFPESENDAEPLMTGVEALIEDPVPLNSSASPN